MTRFKVVERPGPSKWAELAKELKNTARTGKAIVIPLNGRDTHQSVRVALHIKAQRAGFKSHTHFDAEQQNLIAWWEKVIK